MAQLLAGRDHDQQLPKEGVHAEGHHKDQPEEEELGGAGLKANHPVGDGHEDGRLKEQVGHLNKACCCGIRRTAIHGGSPFPVHTGKIFTHALAWAALSALGPAVQKAAASVATLYMDEEVIIENRYRDTAGHADHLHIQCKQASGLSNAPQDVHLKHKGQAQKLVTCT